MSQHTVVSLRPDVELATELREEARRDLIATLIAIGRPAFVEKGAVIFETGDRSDDHGLVLLDGEVEVAARDGESKMVRGPRLLGEAKQYDLKCERNATVIVIESAHVWEFLWSDFDAALEQRVPRESQQEIEDWLMEQAFSSSGGG